MKKPAMKRNDECRNQNDECLLVLARRFHGTFCLGLAQGLGQLVEDTVHKGAGFTGAEGFGDVDGFVEVLLVVDATTGSNALQQAREFNKIIPLTGLIVTKLDGSGKGGILVAIQQELGVPTRFIGLGERVEDFQPFDSKRFVEELL